MVMWLPSRAGGLPPGTSVASHTRTTRTQTSVPTSMIYISCMDLFLNRCKINKVFKKERRKNLFKELILGDSNISDVVVG